MKTFGKFGAVLLSLLCVVSSAFAQNIYDEYHAEYWQGPGFNDCLLSADECNVAGKPTSYKASFVPPQDAFNPFPNRLSLRITFEEYKGNLPNYFAFVISAGEMPGANDTGVYSYIVVDTSGTTPVISAYAYNGGYEPSWISGAVGQPSDTIISTLSDPGWSASVAVEETVVGGNNRRTFRLVMDTDPIQNYTPKYPSGKTWVGNAFGPTGFGIWLFPSVVASTTYTSDGFLSSWSVYYTGQLEKVDGQVGDVCKYDCLGNLLEGNQKPAICVTPTPTPTATNTPTATATPTATYTPTATSTATPTATATHTPPPESTITPTPVPPTATPTPVPPTPTPTPTPDDPVTPLGCSDEDNTEILATIDSTASDIAKIARKAARSVKKLGGDKKSVRRAKKLSATVQELNIQSWTQAWSIPAITKDCEVFSAQSCNVTDLQPLIASYNSTVIEMQNNVRKIVRSVRRLSRKRAAKLNRALRKRVSTALASSGQLPIQTLSCR